MLTDQQKSIRGIMISEQPTLTIPDYLIYLRSLDDDAQSGLINNYAADKVASLQTEIQNRQNDISLIQQAIDRLNQSIADFTIA